MPSRLLIGIAVSAVLNLMAAVTTNVNADEPAASERRGLAPIVALAISLNGKEMVSASQAGLSPQRLRTGIANPHALAFSPDGRSMLVCGGEPGQGGQLEIFDWSSQAVSVAPQRALRIAEDSLYAAAWSPTGESIAVAGLDGFGRVVDASTGQELLQLSGHSRGLTGIEFLTPKRLVTSSLDGSLRVWDADSGELLRTLANHTGAVTGLCPGPQREPTRLRMVASFGDDRTVRLWQPEIGRLVRFVRLSSKPLAVAWIAGNAAAVSHGGLLAVVCLDGHVRLVAVDTVAILAERPVLDGPAFCIAVGASQESLIVAGHRGQIESVRLADLLQNATSAN